MQVIWDITPVKYQVPSNSNNYSFYSNNNKKRGRFDIYVKFQYDEIDNQYTCETVYGNTNKEQEKSINLEMEDHIKWMFNMFRINSNSDSELFEIIIQSVLDIVSREFVMNYLYNVPQNKYTAMLYRLHNNAEYPIIPVFIKNTDQYINSALNDTSIITGTEFMPMKKEFFFITTDEFNRLKMLENVYFAEFHNNILTLYRKRNGRVTFCKSKCKYNNIGYNIPEDQELMLYIENSIKEMYNENIWATNWDIISLLLRDLSKLDLIECYSVIKTYGPQVYNIMKTIRSFIY